MSAWILLFPLGCVYAAGRPVQLPDYYRVETAGTPAISPDGRWVVFVRNTTVEAENQHHSELWISPADGCAPATLLTTPAFSASAPKWSPDGKLLAFRSVRRASGGGDTEGRGGRGGRGGADAEGDVWSLRMDRAGGEAFQIPGVGGAPIFSPDNRWIAFLKRIPPPRSEPAEPDGHHLHYPAPPIPGDLEGGGQHATGGLAHRTPGCATPHVSDSQSR